LAPVTAATPGLLRVAGGAALNLTVWGARAYVRTGTRLARAMVDGQELAALAREAADAVETVVAMVRPGQDDELLGGRASTLAAVHESLPALDDSPDGLRRRGQDLLERSRQVWVPEQGHPAYGRILDELAPDEARVLLHLLTDGPQPSVDVRQGGLRSGALIAPGLTMIGSEAGVRFGDQVPAYLNNLSRLGLIWFSKEALRDTTEYQVLEAQPDVLSALHAVRMAKVVRRSIQLTPFGVGFCRACLSDDAGREFPEHSSPLATESSEPPKQR